MSAKDLKTTAAANSAAQRAANLNKKWRDETERLLASHKRSRIRDRIAARRAEHAQRQIVAEALKRLRLIGKQAAFGIGSSSVLFSAGARLIQAVSLRQVSRQVFNGKGETSFHFAFSSVSREITGNSSASAHVRYVSRESAVASFVDQKKSETARLVGYASRPSAVAKGAFIVGTNEMEPDGRKEGLAVFGNIGPTQRDQERFWRLVEECERVPSPDCFVPIAEEQSPDRLCALAHEVELITKRANQIAFDEKRKTFVFRAGQNLLSDEIGQISRLLESYGVRSRFVKGRGGRVQYRLIMSLPCELNIDRMQSMCDEFTQIFRDENLPYFGAIHAPDDRENNPLNWHVHLCFHDRPVRRVVVDGAEKWDIEAYGVGGHGDIGASKLSKKIRWINDRGVVKTLRRRWAVLANRHLAEAGHKKRWNAETYKEMGIDLSPQKRISQKAYQLEKRGLETRQGVARIRGEQAASAQRVRLTPPEARVAAHHIYRVCSDPAARPLIRRKHLKDELEKPDAPKEGRLWDELKAVNCVLAEVHGGTGIDGVAKHGPFKGRHVRTALAQGQFGRSSNSETTSRHSGEMSPSVDHPDGPLIGAKMRLADKLAGEELARVTPWEFQPFMKRDRFRAPTHSTVDPRWASGEILMKQRVHDAAAPREVCAEIKTEVEPSASHPVEPLQDSSEMEWLTAFLSYFFEPDEDKRYNQNLVRDVLLDAAEASPCEDEIHQIYSDVFYGRVRQFTGISLEAIEAIRRKAILLGAETDRADWRRMTRLKIADCLWASAEPFETSAGKFVRIQKDLAFALADPIYSPIIAEIVTASAGGDNYFDGVFPARPDRNMAAQSQQVMLPEAEFALRVEYFTQTVVDSQVMEKPEGPVFHALRSKALQRFFSFLQNPAPPELRMPAEPPFVSASDEPPGYERMKASRRTGAAPKSIVACPSRTVLRLLRVSDHQLFEDPDKLQDFWREALCNGTEQEPPITSPEQFDKALSRGGVLQYLMLPIERRRYVQPPAGQEPATRSHKPTRSMEHDFGLN